MAVFDNADANMWQRLDWSILKNGWISLYWKKQYLETDIERLKTEDYTIVEFDCRQWINENIMHAQFKQKLGFPEYYGENFDALNDCLSDVKITKTGMTIIFRHLDTLEAKITHTILDIFADNARIQMLFGCRLITLVQVDNPNFQISSIGANPVVWNQQEWLKSK